MWDGGYKNVSRLCPEAGLECCCQRRDRELERLHLKMEKVLNDMQIIKNSVSGQTTSVMTRQSPRRDMLADVNKSCSSRCQPDKTTPDLIAPAQIFMIAGDLFTDAPPQSAMAHCVGADFLMGAGLAVTFRRRFGFQGYLQSLSLRPGEVAQVVCDKEDRLIFHLVTKPRSAHCRPLPEDFRAAVFELARRCVKAKVSTLSIPRIGAGLDRLPCPWVRGVLEEAFAGKDIDVLVFTLPAERQQRKQRTVAPKRSWPGGARKTTRVPDAAVEGGSAGHGEALTATTGATTFPSMSSPTPAASNSSEPVLCSSPANVTLAGDSPACADKTLTPDRPITTSGRSCRVPYSERLYNDCKKRYQLLIEDVSGPESD
ncbi:Hypothetical predicted protein [Cloeon dipterum]|uniref:Macro domain-containing protein n=1 Tax=Cloeon dipterum TaxID=197152 RepID=A0A8S1E0A9_9INSE|nr:Hypothetical predicted protein [Cloeon dipterum]